MNCLICDCAAEQYVCTYCYKLLPWVKDCCYQCGKELLTAKESVKCEECLNNWPGFDRLFAVFNYQNPIKSLMQQFKFNGKLYIGKSFGNLLLHKVLNLWYIDKPYPEVIIPVPLYKNKLKQRGYNQTLELLRPLIKCGVINVSIDLCKKKQETISQKELEKISRKFNLADKFYLTRDITLGHIAIFDDIVTTGSTVAAISNIFYAANPNIIIDVWCICRA